MNENKHVLYKALYKMIRTTRSRPGTSTEKIRSLANLYRKLKKFNDLLFDETRKIASELMKGNVEEYFIKQGERVTRVNVSECVTHIAVLPIKTKKDKNKAMKQYNERGYKLEQFNVNTKI